MEKERFEYVPLVEIGKSPWQARKGYDEQAMEELIVSVKEKGVLQPVLVRPVEPYTEGALDLPSTGKKVKYQLVAGERRLRAVAFVAEENGGIKGAVIPAMVRGMTDDEAFDAAMIENLQRRDLNELEEASGFRAWLDRHQEDAGAAETLAERIGVSAKYIRRRVHLLALPGKVLEAWGKGQIAYGFLEQFARLGDEKEILDLFRRVMEREWRFEQVKDIKRLIDERAPALKSAKFPLEPCASCGQNTEVQADLFGEDVPKGARCLNPKCFKQKQNHWLLANWKKTGWYKQHGTQGFRFFDDVGYNKFNEWYTGKPAKKCRECNQYVTLLTLDGKAEHGAVCIGEKSCFEGTRKKASASAKATADRGSNEEGPRVSWHGSYFREQFYQEALPLRLRETPAEDVKTLRAALFNLLLADPEIEGWFMEQSKEGEDEDGYRGSYVPPGQLWTMIETMNREEVLEVLREATLQGLLEKQRGEEARAVVAKHFEIDLEKEWLLTKEYLDKKTTKEIHQLAAEFGLWERKEAKAFLFETLLKKRGSFKSCKKSELVQIILDSGMDLAGVVPKEIKQGASAFAEAMADMGSGEV